MIELLEPVVEAYEDDNYHDILTAVDELYNDFDDDDFQLFNKNINENVAAEKFNHNMENAKFSDKERSTSAYNQIKYASGGSYPQGRYA